MHIGGVIIIIRIIKKFAIILIPTYFRYRKPYCMAEIITSVLFCNVLFFMISFHDVFSICFPFVFKKTFTFL